jgi:signal transduction histidine kinase
MPLLPHKINKLVKRSLILCGSDDRVDDNLHVLGDDDNIIRILTNLLGNALKYSEYKVKIITERVDDDYVNINIIDRGIGIEEKYYAKVFGKFKRFTLSKQGVGLGLYSSKRLAKLMNADITFISTPNIKTVFTLKMMLTEHT